MTGGQTVMTVLGVGLLLVIIVAGATAPDVEPTRSSTGNVSGRVTIPSSGRVEGSASRDPLGSWIVTGKEELTATHYRVDYGSGESIFYGWDHYSCYSQAQVGFPLPETTSINGLGDKIVVQCR
jgi:hypothetical protein